MISQNSFGEALLSLSGLKDDLIHCVLCHELEDRDIFGLSDSVTAILSREERDKVRQGETERKADLSLSIVLRVKVKVVENDSVSSREVDAKPTRLRGEDEDWDGSVFLKAVDKFLSLPDRGRAIQTKEFQTHIFH
jgi:hypothetical protein